MGLGQRALAVVHPHVPVDVEEPEGGAPGRHAPLGQQASEALGAAQAGQARELVAQGLDLGGPVQSEEPAQIGRRVLLERFGALDAQQRHEQQREERGPQPVERRADGAVDLARDGEHPGGDQGGEGEQDPGARHVVATAEERGGVVEQAHVSQEPIEAAVRWIAVQARRDRLGLLSGVRQRRARPEPRGPRLHHGDRRSGQGSVRSWRCRPGGRPAGIRCQSGQVWVRTGRGRIGQRQRDLGGVSRGPAQTAQALADGLLIDAEPMGDGAVGQADGLELADHAIARGTARAALGIATDTAQPGQAALVEAPLMPSDRTRRATEGARHLVLVGPALLDQADHRVGLGDPVAGDEVRQRDPSGHNDPQLALDTHHAAVVDNERVRGTGLGPKQPGLRPGVDHGPYNVPIAPRRARPRLRKKRTGLGPHPTRTISSNYGRLLTLCQEVCT